MAVILRTGSLFRLSKVVPVFGLRCASSLKVKKGLVVGVYSEEDKGTVDLTRSAETYNKISNGKLLEHIKLFVLNYL
ncbi:hypothetical protein QE152_g653 [Popillia japonica]|uniref:Uncharacterized protein n=1 Tax=Popillia japonica TaxID=7064 RepID=A0AAW1NBA5_POPJA